MASNVCKSSCACAHEFNRSICTVVARLEFVCIYTCCIIAKVEWLVIACILSECTWHMTITLFFSKCLATVASAIVFCKALTAPIAKALPLQQHCLVCIVPRLWIKRLLLEMPERAKLFALHACSHYCNNPLASSISESFGRRISECLYFS